MDIKYFVHIQMSEEDIKKDYDKMKYSKDIYEKYLL